MSKRTSIIHTATCLLLFEIGDLLLICKCVLRGAWTTFLLQNHQYFVHKSIDGIGCWPMCIRIVTFQNQVFHDAKLCAIILDLLVGESITFITQLDIIKMYSNDGHIRTSLNGGRGYSDSSPYLKFFFF